MPGRNSCTRRRLSLRIAAILGLVLSLGALQGCCICDKDAGDPSSRGIVVRSFVGGGVSVPDGEYQVVIDFEGEQAVLETRVTAAELSETQVQLPSGWRGSIELFSGGNGLKGMVWGEEEVECGTRFYGPELPVEVQVLRDGIVVATETIDDAYVDEVSSSGEQCGSFEVRTLSVELEETP